MKKLYITIILFVLLVCQVMGESIHDAAEKGHLKTITKLLSQNINVNEKDKNGKTALMLASINDNIIIEKVLLDNGADINLQDNQGRTALMWAADRGNSGSVKFLLEKGADINVKDKDHHTALTIAMNKKYDEVVKILHTKSPKFESKVFLFFVYRFIQKNSIFLWIFLFLLLVTVGPSLMLAKFIQQRTKQEIDSEEKNTSKEQKNI